MYFHRFNIVEAWYLALMHCHSGQWSIEYLRFCKMQKYFKPSPLLSVETLNDNAKQIYESACNKLLSR
jgi:hypothetical protein